MDQGGLVFHGSDTSALRGAPVGLTINVDCLVCRKPLLVPSQWAMAHDACLLCPTCGSDFVMWWQRKDGQRAKLRCIACLHYWEGSDDAPHQEVVTP